LQRTGISDGMENSVALPYSAQAHMPPITSTTKTAAVAIAPTFWIHLPLLKPTTFKPTTSHRSVNENAAL
jgi:hypothetical protein